MNKYIKYVLFRSYFGNKVAKLDDENINNLSSEQDASEEPVSYKTNKNRKSSANTSNLNSKSFLNSNDNAALVDD